MAKHIKKVESGYAIDRFVQRDGIRLHVYKAGFRTIADAKYAMDDEIQKAFDAVKSSRYGEKTLRQCAEAYFRDMSAKKSRQYAYSIRKKMEKHFLSHFDLDELARKELTEAKISQWYSKFGAYPEIRADTKNKLLSDVRRFMEGCWRKEKAISSEEYASIMGVLDNFKVPKAPTPEKAVWGEDEIGRFIASNERGSSKWVMFSLFFYLGARIAEFLALTWDCVDWDNQEIRIGKQLLKDGGYLVTDELKTGASYRSCYLEDWVMEMLKDYKKKEGNPEAAYLFHSDRNPNGERPMSFNDFRNHWAKSETKAGLPHTTPHSARHRKATELIMLCRNEEEVKASAEFLGHSPSMMMDVYAHTNRESIKKLMARKGN